MTIDIEVLSALNKTAVRLSHKAPHARIPTAYVCVIPFSTTSAEAAALLEDAVDKLALHVGRNLVFGE